MSDIIIRRIEASDARATSEIYKNVNAYSETLHLPHPSVPQWEKRFGNIPDNVHAYVAIIGNEIVGNGFLSIATNLRRRHVGDIGIAVKDNFHGKGVGSALFETIIDLADNWLNLQRIELTVFTDNEKAISLYKKFGFEIEGEAKAFAFRDGQYANAYYMARIKPN